MRIGINIPNELMRRLEPLKPELNISQVCREALISKAEKHENAMRHLEDERTHKALNEVFEQESKFRAIFDMDWEEKGYENAVLWVQCATLRNWNDLYKLRAIRREQGRPEWEAELRLVSDEGKRVPCFDELYRDYYDTRLAQGDEFYDWLEAQDVDIDWDYAHRAYGQSWLTYVDAAWNVICEWLERDQQTLSEKRDDTRANRPTPVVPEHLLSDSGTSQTGSFQVLAHQAELVEGVDPLKLNRIAGEPDVDSYLADGQRAQ